MVIKALCVASVAIIVLLLSGGLRHHRPAQEAQGASLVQAAATSEVTPAVERPAFSAPPAPKAPVMLDPRGPAAFCSKLDPIAHPEQVYDVLVYASQYTKTPLEVLYAVWLKEAGTSYGSAPNDVCPLKEQLHIRCVTGKSCSHEQALQWFVDTFHWHADTMQCSCGKSTLTFNAKSFGGCCGPWNASLGEVLKNAQRLRLDPMVMCDGAILAGFDLQVKYEPSHNWGVAMAGYYGNDRDGRYLTGALMRWKEIQVYLPPPGKTLTEEESRRYEAQLRQFLIRQASHGLSYSIRSLRSNGLR